MPSSNILKVCLKSVIICLFYQYIYINIVTLSGALFFEFCVLNIYLFSSLAPQFLLLELSFHTVHSEIPLCCYFYVRVLFCGECKSPHSPLAWKPHEGLLKVSGDFTVNYFLYTVPLVFFKKNINGLSQSKFCNSCEPSQSVAKAIDILLIKYWVIGLVWVVIVSVNQSFMVCFNS